FGDRDEFHLRHRILLDEITPEVIAMFHIVYSRGEPIPLLDDAPQVDSETRSIPLELDPRSAKCLRALLDLGPNFDVALMLGAVYHAGVRAGERAARCGSAPPPAG